MSRPLKTLCQTIPVRMRMSRGQQGAITLGTRGEKKIVGRGLRGLQVCLSRIGVPVWKG